MENDITKTKIIYLNEISACNNYFNEQILLTLSTMMPHKPELVSLFNGLSTFVAYLMSKPSLLKNFSATTYSITGIARRFMPFPRVLTKLKLKLYVHIYIYIYIYIYVCVCVCVCVCECVCV